MKIFTVKFEPCYNVPHGLVIAAVNIEEARKIAEHTIQHTHVEDIEEVDTRQPCVIFYQSGEY